MQSGAFKYAKQRPQSSFFARSSYTGNAIPVALISRTDKRQAYSTIARKSVALKMHIAESTALLPAVSL